MNTKKLFISILTIAVLCLSLFLCGCTKKDGDVGDNPDHSSSSSPSTSTSTPTANPTASHSESPLESMIPDVIK
ncbi:MAG: hypothetical protein J6C24_00940 [Clostridia bacterium]|nr:hypothetical protein [Clostridia bacterium]